MYQQTLPFLLDRVGVCVGRMPRYAQSDVQYNVCILVLMYNVSAWFGCCIVLVTDLHAFVGLFVCLFIYIFIYLFISLSIYLSIHFYRLIYLFISLSIYVHLLTIYIFIHSFIFI